MGSTSRKTDETVLMAAIAWTVPTLLVFLVEVPLLQMMQRVVVLCLFVLPATILWTQAILSIGRRRTRVTEPS